MHKVIVFVFFILCSLKSYGHHAIDKPHILVSIAPYKFLVEQIAEDTCFVYTIVTNHYDPHSYELPPRQIKSLQQGDLWFRIGEAFEKTCEKNLTCEQVDLSKNVSLIQEKSCCNKHTTNYDTHIWLSPTNLKIQVETIVTTLSSKYPKYASQYQRNGTKLLSILDELDQEVRILTSKAKQRHILVSHGAFGYFCRDYNFSQHTLEKSSHVDPSPKDVARIFHEIEHYKISSVILLEYAGRRSSAMLAKRFHMHTVNLDPYAENVILNLKTIATTFSSL
ncbi:Probable zinc transport system zinc-binding lipoprotein AdcA precursor,high-affinity zinc transporter periplasmic component,ABC-type Zn2 transport system, periplasmic component/surface adhesin,anchored repeat ABC transporter, substrate-binding protein,Periplasmic solute binding protein family [Chlamydia serpentis]|uniref:Uncharacterized protein n=1 Tax=Chlamydia serpentis TaxID=1967782 RepID=A0A2R8FB42_9CHLA|nr:zinc ABC transporter substrate-binding protein [Chlamydia serpentis]SPN73660.1 Probable zinc transport system zinc-binding lipoprotein AdcA precursor,high-affinity zinc transporter periplasmic component,ABC-type Zn2 transport system, periplasmic component/surface adhesin,anchored repeat ABC transporter, substrate-binding protein,Periplasmic solute binding protein family [Chlamydia serpentis]